MESQSIAGIVIGGGVGVTIALTPLVINRFWGKRDKQSEESLTLKIQRQTAIEQRVNELYDERSELVKEVNAQRADLVREATEWRERWLASKEELLTVRSQHLVEMESWAARYNQLKAAHDAMALNYTNLQEAYATLDGQYAAAIRKLDDMEIAVEHMQAQLDRQKNQLASAGDPLPQ